MLDEIKGFKYQITLKMLLRKHKFYILIVLLRQKLILNMILINLFNGILYRINNWTNEGSGWAIESINGEYVKIFI